jgi:hypothetical protein
MLSPLPSLRTLLPTGLAALALCASLLWLDAVPVHAEPVHERSHAPAVQADDADNPSIAALMGQAALLNEETCASAECHPMLNEVPATSRHGHVRCVSCHGQRRAHTEACVECHEKVLGDIDAGSTEELRERMRQLREDDQLEGCDVSGIELPDAVDCLVCHLKLQARPLTFPQIVPEEHIPADQAKQECVECHRAHDPKPQMGHEMPLPYCRRGRDCCLSCHVKIDELSSGDRVERPEKVPSGVTRPPEELRDAEWMQSGFADWVLQPPLVDPDHGHGTVECVACHSAPPAFHELAKRVHNWEHESVRCGKCHTGSNLVDQQVLLLGEHAQGHDDGDAHH